MYSPTLGRFMQTDPIGYGDWMNMYAYVGGDPVNGVDPTGLQAATKECAVGHFTCPPSPPPPDIEIIGERLPDLDWARNFDLRDLCILDPSLCQTVILVIADAGSAVGPPSDLPTNDACTIARRINLSVGVGGTLAAGFGIIGGRNAGGGFGAGVEMGISIPLTSIGRLELTGAQSFFRGTGTILAGAVGAYVGGGENFAASISEGARPYEHAIETSTEQTIQGGVAYGAGGEVIVPDGGYPGISGGPRGGYGAYFGRGLSGSVEHTTDPIGCP